MIANQWTPPKVALLKVLWSEGYSAESIVLRLEITGNNPEQAVREKVHREGFLRHQSYRHIVLGAAFQPRPKNVGDVGLRRKKTEPGPALRDGAPISLSDVLPHECRWIAGKLNGDPQVCGHKVARGSWCATHVKRVYERELGRTTCPS